MAKNIYEELYHEICDSIYAYAFFTGRIIGISERQSASANDLRAALDDAIKDLNTRLQELKEKQTNKT